MTNSDVRKRLENIFVKREVAREKLQYSDKVHYHHDLGLDSLEFVEIMIECETEFEITIPDEDESKLQTFGELLAYIEKRVLKQPSPA